MRGIGRVSAGLTIVFFVTIAVGLPLVGLLQRIVLAAMCAWIVTVTVTMAHARSKSGMEEVA